MASAEPSAAAAAAAHYHGGRYAHAASAFALLEERGVRRRHKLVPLRKETNHVNDCGGAADEGEGDIVLADDGPIAPTRTRTTSRRVELIALPPLAYAADRALCKFRSAVAGPSTKSNNANNDKTPKSTLGMWKEALEANADYRLALRGAATSLAQTCNMELHNKQQYPQLPKRTKDHKSIRAAMQSTGLAVLMAAIAASHLHLHHTDGQRNGKAKVNAWNVLVDAAVTSAELLRIRNEWTNKLDGRDDDDSRLKALGSKPSRLEDSLRLLNDELCNNPTSTEEKERGNVAMHAFRSALKVAALATGKLVLPTMGNEAKKEGDKPPAKRPRVKKETEEDAKKDAWNATYRHPSPMLHARERLVDALSFHAASTRYPTTREAFVGKRDACLEEAVAWENRTIDDMDAMETEGGCAGYAWKVRTCLHAMELASPSQSDGHDDEPKKALKSLEVLASSSTSQYACDLLGCIYAQHGEVSRAIEQFQLSMDRGEQRNGTSDSDEEHGGGAAERRTIANMALCFLALGEAHTPLELLLHVWMTSSDIDSSDADVPWSTALLLSPGSCDKEHANGPTVPLDRATKMQLLWRVFHASSLAQDWGTCLHALEELPGENGDNSSHEAFGDVARAFALLQCRRPAAALEMTSATTGPGSTSRAGLLQVVAELYHADAFLLDEQSEDAFDDGNIPRDCTKRAMAALEFLLKGRGENSQSHPLLQELRVATHTNHGMASLAAGDSVEALRCCREAVARASSTGSSSDAALSWLIMPAYFNLSLLLLRDGHTEESAKSWLLARGHIATWQKAVRGDNEALRTLKDLRTMAVNRHGLLMAKRSMQGDSTSWDQEVIMEWTPPVAEQDDVDEDSTRAGGVDASQITALDVVLLRHAVSVAEKRASSSFRRTAGHIGL